MKLNIELLTHYLPYRLPVRSKNKQYNGFLASLSNGDFYDMNDYCQISCGSTWYKEIVTNIIPILKPSESSIEIQKLKVCIVGSSAFI